jgi:hypothetical protein
VNESDSWKWEVTPVYNSENQHIYIYPHSRDDSEDECNVEVNGDAPQDEVTQARPQRTRQVPNRLSDCEVLPDNAVNEEGDLIHTAMLADAEPIDYRDGLKSSVWKKAMEEELQSIEKNQTWKLVNLPNKKKKIDVKWVFKVKLNPDVTISKHKVRLIARGFLQKQGVDYNEVFAPIARIETVGLVVTLACKNIWDLYNLDVKSTFLNGPLEEEVYVTQPPGFEIKGKQKMVYRLYKALYGLKQAPRAWNNKIDQFLIQIGFKRCAVEFGVYVQSQRDEDMVIICLYVDDLLTTGSQAPEIEKLKGKLKDEFEMNDLG